MTSTTQSSTKCPKCGAEKGHLGFLLCGSRQRLLEFDQSDSCRDRENTTLRASLAEVVEALKPFADMVPRSHMTVPDETEVTWETEYWNGPSKWAENWPAATVGDLRRASAVLNEISKDL